ncbi:hypothetical protein GQ61_01280 [Candidatus Nucleicultrix amoebiphila FS5]|uniref:Uncharacterized protein n=1 Tax=Candidatus Nucleicultrix amoebiphila FS5 TaxID=1414854 RepID=A0A1W6N2X4_9PROT|nr:hypothetical protein GQ61_01280 [Candidatus Nucleicultrix amoebiphila FS5]
MPAGPGPFKKIFRVLKEFFPGEKRYHALSSLSVLSHPGDGGVKESSPKNNKKHRQKTSSRWSFRTATLQRAYW